MAVERARPDNHSLDAMRVELLQTGGVGNLAVRVEVEDDRVILVDRGIVKIERALRADERQSIAQLVKELTTHKLRASYGRGFVSDPLQSVLSIKLNSDTTTVSVSTDPSDPPPPQFSQLVQRLFQLAR